ncbi:MAG: hypothetical protein RLZZ584_3625 [Pseudomonadota bacterium]
MFSHVVTSVSQFDRAFTFYSAILPWESIEELRGSWGVWGC